MKWIFWAGLIVTATGCLDRDWRLNSSLGKPVAMPKVKEASVAAAARVDQVARRLTAGNPFLGVEPIFQTVGTREPEIFHPDTTGVFISEGLVERCTTDEQLAAVLASELGKMVAERRVVDRMKLPDPMPTLNDSGAMSPGGIGSDQNQLGVQALFDQGMTAPRPSPRSKSDPRAISEEILKNGGFSVKDLDAAKQLLDAAARNHRVSDQIDRKGDRPVWTP